MSTPCPACGGEARMVEAWREWHIECACGRRFFVPDLSCKKRRVALAVPGVKWERAELARDGAT